MNRVFPSLVFTVLALFIVTGTLGLLIGRYNVYPAHFVLAMFTLAVTVLIHVIAFTYFAASGRMMSQAVLLGHLDKGPLEQAKQFQARVGMCVGVAFVTLIPVVALGGIVQRDPSLATWHLACGVLALIVNAAMFRAEMGFIRRNSELMKSVYAEYNARRGEGTP
jgi:hypothetical protein